MRKRPEWHFTAQQGWINDPHGIVHYGGQYHMFFQHNPADIAWAKECHWGHAVSPDLVSWTELPIALTPENEVGCWSGSAVVTEDGVTILYTTIRHADFGRGAVALAHGTGDLVQWSRSAGPNVIDGQPAELDVVAFRDPYVWKVDGGWKAVLGAGLVGFGGTALQYSSPDLSHWTFDGLLAKRAYDDRDPVWTGKVWECPQLVQIGEKWLLTVSVWDDDELHYVAYAIGTYDGQEFSAEKWARFSYGDIAYATSIFRDTSQTPVAMSWLRETNNSAPSGSPWASAISLPFELSLDGLELHVRHHHHFEHSLPQSLPTETGQSVALVAPFLLSVQGHLEGVAVRIEAEGGDISVQVGDDSVVIQTADGNLLLELPRTRPGTETLLEVSIDADILEATWSACAGVGATRINAISTCSVSIEPTSSRVSAVIFQR